MWERKAWGQLEYSQTRIRSLEEGRGKKLPGRKVSWLLGQSGGKKVQRQTCRKICTNQKSTSSPTPVMELKILNSTFFSLCQYIQICIYLNCSIEVFQFTYKKDGTNGIIPAYIQCYAYRSSPMHIYKIYYKSIINIYCYLL